MDGVEKEGVLRRCVNMGVKRGVDDYGGVGGMLIPYGCAESCSTVRYRGCIDRVNSH